MKNRECVTGRDPDAPVSVPDFTTQFWNGDGIREIAEKMISAYPELSWLTEEEGQYSVEFFWKQKGGVRGELRVLGNTAKASGLAGFMSGATWHIWMAADHCRTLSNYEFEAALFHQMLHLGEREVEDSDPDMGAKMIPVTRPHEVEMFREEITRYGFWSSGLLGASHAFASQLKLDLSPRETPIDDFDDGIGDESRRREKQALADTVAAKGDGVKIVYDGDLDAFRTGEGDIYANGAIEASAGVSASAAL